MPTYTHVDAKNKLARALTNVSTAGVHALFSPTTRPNGSNFTRYGKDIDSLLRYTTQKRNWYLSLNTFGSWKRRASNVLGLNAIYIDVDCTKNGVDKGEFLFYFVRWCETQKMPWPTSIIDSGHGFYLIYLFDKQVVNHNSAILRLWNKLERTMVNRLNKYCKHRYGKNLGDMKSTDPGRVLRVPGTLNLKKAPLKCFVNYFDEGHRPNMFKMVDKYLPSLTYLKKKKAYKKRSKALKKGVDRYTHKTRYSLNYQRIHDLTQWLKMNSYSITGKREEFLFLYACAALRIRSRGFVIKRLYQLNHEFTEPLLDSEVWNLKVEIHHIDLTSYKFKNSTIINLLGIDSDQQAQMSTLIDQSEHYNRRKKRRHAISKKKHAQKAIRNKDIVELHNDGLSCRKIAKAVGVSRQTVSNVLRK